MTAHRDHGFQITPHLRRGLRSEIPLPTRLVSNEEFAPLPQTPAQQAVEHRILAGAGRLAPRLGLSRRDFLRTSAPVHLRRAAALRRRGLRPARRGSRPQGAVSKGGLLRLRKSAKRLNPRLASDRGTLADLSWAKMVKEVFLDSETSIGLISTPPGPYPQDALVPSKEMTHIRNEIPGTT